MARVRYVRKNSDKLRWLSAIALASVTSAALLAIGSTSTVISLGCALAVGVLTAYSAPLGALAMVLIIGIPVLAADLVVGIIFLLVGLGTTQYLGDHQARGFVVVALAALAVALHAEWAVVVLAGYLLGSGPGAAAAVVSCVLIQLAGIMLGDASLGTVITGGSTPGVLSFSATPSDPFMFGWVSDSVAAVAPESVIDALTGVSSYAVLAAQAGIWGAAAAMAGLLRRPGERPVWMVLGGTLGVMAALGAATLALSGAAGVSAVTDVLSLTSMISAAVLALGVFVTEIFFGLRVPDAKVARHGVGTEDADVDELLSTIASAEEALTSRHTAQAVVLITDMKSFSAMTEDVGSVESAKLVQRQRDLLLPIIDAHGGSGKSTGGDGLVAAFDQPSEAAEAAVAMQRAIAETFGADSPVAVRIGVAQGEVVLDRRGRPFIGAALNLAARVMDLADGGRIMMETGAAEASGTAATFDHGDYKLKNIQEPVRVTEILWHDGMAPGTPHGEHV